MNRPNATIEYRYEAADLLMPDRAAELGNDPCPYNGAKRALRARGAAERYGGVRRGMVRPGAHGDRADQAHVAGRAARTQYPMLLLRQSGRLSHHRRERRCAAVVESISGSALLHRQYCRRRDPV